MNRWPGFGPASNVKWALSQDQIAGAEGTSHSGLALVGLDGGLGRQVGQAGANGIQAIQSGRGLDAVRRALEDEAVVADLDSEVLQRHADRNLLFNQSTGLTRNLDWPKCNGSPHSER